MKIFLFIAIISGIFFVPVFAQSFDNLGLNSRLDVTAGGTEFEILTTANFDVTNAKFNLADKTLTLSIASSIENNFGETTIPKKLLYGDLTFVLDGENYSPNVKSNEKIWFITTQFNGTGMHTLEIIGTESVANVSPVPVDVPETNDDDNGCLIATATYGSELAPQVQQLREIRDNSLLQTQSGTTFMTSFNQFYYTFSPTIADWERQNPAFKEAVKITITPLISSLAILNYADIDSEAEMLGYGIGVIAMNIGMYFGPIIGLVYCRKHKLF